jgi:RND family efflux transporter MFP subunit
VAKAKSELEAANITLKLEKTVLERIQKQIDSCEVKSPGDGILVYAKERYWDENSRIQAGAMVYYRQPLFSLPDLTQMQMKVQIHEAFVEKIKAGQKVEINIAACRGKVLKGTVKTVGTLANLMGWYERAVKQYDTIVTIEDLPQDANLKVGFTGDAKILVNELPDVLMVPVQAVGKKEGKHYCYVAGEKGIEAREVIVGENNDKFVEIKEGLAEGEKVTLDARARIAEEMKGRETKPETPPEKPQPPEERTAPGPR